MFETSLVVRRRSRRWGWLLLLAVLMHGVIATAVVLASVWRIPEVVPPQLVEMVYVTLPPPLGDDTPPPARSQPPAPHQQASPPATTPTVATRPPETQPPVIPDTVPVAPSTPTVDETTTTSSDSNSQSTSGGPGVPWGSQNGSGDADTPIDITVGMTKPEAIVKVTPLYTEGARIARVQGVVILRATIDREGRVTDAQVLKPLGFGLDQSAMIAVQQWRFRPATLNGRPVPVYFQLSVTFTVR